MPCVILIFHKMKSLFLIFLAAYVVRSYEDDYYVIEIPDDTPTQLRKPFKVYWNVPTMQCSSKKIYFEKLYEMFGIIQNDNDQFLGEKITILYDQNAGFFPAIFKNDTGEFWSRNGGVPQEGDMDRHLDKFKKDLDNKIPDKNFNGVGIIDFEVWRPVFRQNYGEQVSHKDLSFAIEQKLHPEWEKADIETEAKRRFEEASRKFMQMTLSVAKQLRPNAFWGFYGFPYCYNMNKKTMEENCARNVPQENDQISWLWSESTALYPSIYSSASLSTAQLQALIRGRLQEAARNARGQIILPYFWFRYEDAGFLSETDLNMALATLYESNTSGTIIWGSSNDVDTVPKCNKLLKYVETVLGPAVAKYTRPPHGLNDEDNIDIALLSPNNGINSNTKIDLGPKYHWTSLTNKTQDIKTNVENFDFKNVTMPMPDDKDTVLQKSTILVDLILNSDDHITRSDTSYAGKNKTGQSEDVGSVSTTEINSKVTNNETSRITNKLVPNISTLDINNTSPQVDSALSNISLNPDETTITEKIEVQTEDLDKGNFKSHLEIGFVSEITTTDDSKVNYMTEHYYEATLDSEHDYSTITMNQHIVDTTITDSETKLNIHDKKNIFIASTEDYLVKTSDPRTITDNIIDINMETIATNNNDKSLSSEFTDPTTVETTATDKIQVQIDDLDKSRLKLQCVCPHPKGNNSLTSIGTSAPNHSDTYTSSNSGSRQPQRCATLDKLDMSLILMEIKQLRNDLTQQNFDIETKLNTLSAKFEQEIGGYDKNLQAKDVEISILKETLVYMQIRLISQENDEKQSRDHERTRTQT